jgi:hypothetical protein
MGEIIQQHWSLLLLALVAVSMNTFMLDARKGRYEMGSIFRQYGLIFELFNWLILLGVVIFISISHSWWFLFAFFIIPIAGFIISSILRMVTQFVYIFGMPIAIVLVVISLVRSAD